MDEHPPILEEQRVELDFRDGKRWVPFYLANAMSHLETFRYRYADAVEEANRTMVRDVVSSAFDAHIAAHFRGNR